MYKCSTIVKNERSLIFNDIIIDMVRLKFVFLPDVFFVVVVFALFFLLSFGLIEKGKEMRASLAAQMVKNLPAMWENAFDPWVGKIDPLEKGMVTHSSTMTGEFHGQRG